MCVCNIICGLKLVCFGVCENDRLCPKLIYMLSLCQKRLRVLSWEVSKGHLNRGVGCLDP